MSWHFITFRGALLFIIALPLWINSEGWACPIESTPHIRNSTQPHTFISEKNIFSPGRKEFPILTTEEKKTFLEAPGHSIWRGDYR